MHRVGEREFSEIRIPVPWGYIAGRWYGSQEMRPILALHGWQDNCGSFYTLAPLIAPQASLLCIDMPGHGFSSHLPIGVAYQDLEFVRSIAYAMHYFKWKKVSLLGHSLGGGTAFLFAAIFPERVDFIISIDILFGPERAASLVAPMLAHNIKRSLIENERLFAAAQSELNEPPSYSYVECEQLQYVGLAHSVALENCKFLLERSLIKSQKHLDKYYFSRDVRLKCMFRLCSHETLTHEFIQRISKVPIPYLVIKGSASTNHNERTAEIMKAMTALNPLFQLHVIKGGTHHLHLNEPQSVADQILSYLKQHGFLDAGKQETVGDAKQKLKAQL